MNQNPSSTPLRVLIAGGGVAGLEALMALHELAGRRVAVTLLTPDSEFEYKALSVAAPFAGRSAKTYALDKIAADFGAELLPGKLDWVAPGQHAAFTTDGRELSYDVLILALGARRTEPYERVVTFRGGEDSESVHGLIQDVEGAYSLRIAFVVPPGTTWPLPLYELALMTAERSRAMGIEAELTFSTPEESPLGVFGAEASAEVDGLLDAAGIKLETSAYAEVEGGHKVRLRPSGREIDAQRIVTVPVLQGPAPRGVPADAEGFIPIDGHGRVRGVEDVYAAGDGVAFPIKQGGIAAQQADAVAEVVAKRAGAPIEPRSFRPVMRGVLLTGGGEERFLRGEVSRGRDRVSEASLQALWWPPAKIAGRYLAPYLAGHDAETESTATPPQGLAVEIPPA